MVITRPNQERARAHRFAELGVDRGVVHDQVLEGDGGEQLQLALQLPVLWGQ